MAVLLEKDRNRIYTEFKRILGEEATQAMLTQLSADTDQFVTKDYLDARLAEVKHDLAGRMLTLMSVQTAVIGILLAVFR
jgi:hypothetical protein